MEQPENTSDLTAWRRRYARGVLDEADLAADPYAQFARWLADAQAAGMMEPNAAVLATADTEGRPSVRTVLIKGFDDRGFRFFSNGLSRKGRELHANPAAALCFPWHPVERQVTVRGVAEPLAADEARAYFASRPRDSQLGALTSEQSQVIDGRAALEERYAELERRYPGDADIPMPEHWGGWRLAAEAVEFWQGRPGRLHDRLVYRGGASGWLVERLSP